MLLQLDELEKRTVMEKVDLFLQDVDSTQISSVMKHAVLPFLRRIPSDGPKGGEAEKDDALITYILSAKNGLVLMKTILASSLPPRAPADRIIEKVDDVVDLAMKVIG